MRLRKSRLGADDATPTRAADEIDIVRDATIRYSSEDRDHPVDNMLDGTSGPGATRWTAARADTMILTPVAQGQIYARLPAPAHSLESRRHVWGQRSFLGIIYDACGKLE